MKKLLELHRNDQVHDTVCQCYAASKSRWHPKAPCHSVPQHTQHIQSCAAWINLRYEPKPIAWTSYIVPCATFNNNKYYSNYITSNCDWAKKKQERNDNSLYSVPFGHKQADKSTSQTTNKEKKTTRMTNKKLSCDATVGTQKSKLYAQAASICRNVESRNDK